MGQPNPPGDIPVYEGLDSSWNDVVAAIPEDKRGLIAPALKSRIDDYQSRIESYKPWDDMQKSGITPDHAQTALNLFTMIENNPRQVYEEIGKYLGISPQQAKQALTEEVEEATETGDDSRLAALQQQVETMSAIMVAQKQQETAAKEAARHDAAVDKELSDLRKKYPDVDEEEVILRMVHKNLSAEDAYKEYTSKYDAVRRTRPAPMILGQGGSVPRDRIDPTKLNSKDTKALVAQMMQQATNEAKR